jgi:UDP-N-acetylmuramate--L-alanine ligase/UDP-N-acetylenolpyruvoylglucosamine reductase
MLTRQQLIEFLGSGPRRVHFVGVGGCGMSGLAKLLAQQGHAVSGCDLAPNCETKKLQALGVKVAIGHSPRHMTNETELVVHTSAVNGENEELRAAAGLNVATVRRGLLLSALMTHRHNIAVAGTHGKTTTTSMIACVLTRSDSAPTFCIGAHVPNLRTNAQIGGGKYFVAEADESDGTLVSFTPEHAVCLNIEAEHLDHHGSMERLLVNFESFFASTLKTVFYCADCPNCVRTAKLAQSAISFGLSAGADYRAVNIQQAARGFRFMVTCRGQEIGVVELAVPGMQNVVNALATVAVADQLGVPFVKIAEVLGKFTGAKRRFERKYEGNGIVVVDDYAHHPTEIRATLAAARTLNFKRILLAFQPHRYTRTQTLRDQFATAFHAADKLWLADIYAACEPPIPGVTSEALLSAIRVAGQTNAEWEPDFEKLTERLSAEAAPGDLVLVMGAGDIHKVATAVAAKLAARGQQVPHVAEPASVASDLHRLLSDHAAVRSNEPMALRTSMRVGGPAQFWVEPSGEQDLAKLLRYCHERGLPVTLVGRGTNLVVRDGGIAGVVIHLGSEEFSRIKVDGTRLMVGAGVRLKAIIHAARQHELGGLEFLEGIPGSLGGALRMNAGAMGRQVFDVVEWVRYVSLTGEFYDAPAESLPRSYRECPMFSNHIAVAAILRCEKTARAAIDDKLRAFAARRWTTQPAEPSAGCFFRNPEQIAAGKLIDELGLKGLSVGGARVSELHANFIVNEGSATATDVLRLMTLVRERAKHERGIELTPEVMILGKDERVA